MQLGPLSPRGIPPDDVINDKASAALIASWIKENCEGTIMISPGTLIWKRREQIPIRTGTVIALEKEDLLIISITSEIIYESRHISN